MAIDIKKTSEDLGLPTPEELEEVFEKVKITNPAAHALGESSGDFDRQRILVGGKPKKKVVAEAPEVAPELGAVSEPIVEKLKKVRKPRAKKVKVEEPINS